MKKSILSVVLMATFSFSALAESKQIKGLKSSEIVYIMAQDDRSCQLSIEKLKPVLDEKGDVKKMLLRTYPKGVVTRNDFGEGLTGVHSFDAKGAGTEAVLMFFDTKEHCETTMKIYFDYVDSH